MASAERKTRQSIVDLLVSALSQLAPCSDSIGHEFIVCCRRERVSLYRGLRAGPVLRGDFKHTLTKAAHLPVLVNLVVSKSTSIERACANPLLPVEDALDNRPTTLRNFQRTSGSLI